MTTEAGLEALRHLGLETEPDGPDPLRLTRGRGCAACKGTGFRGRVGLFEVMEMSSGIRDLVTAGASPPQITRRALEEGMVTLRASGLEKIRQGVTTAEEVLRETAP